MFYAWAAALLYVVFRVLRPFWKKKLTENDAVLVTGCDVGFGFHIVRALLKATDATVFAGFVSKDGQKNLQALGPRVVTVALDVTKAEEVEATFAAIEKSGKALAGVVNNAGIGCYGYAEALTMECYEKIISINLVGAIRVTRKALPLLRASKGRLVTMGSIGCRMPSAFGSAYLPSKAGIASYQDCVRQETFRFGMRCSLIEPGFFATGMLHRSAAIGDSASKAPAAAKVDESISQAYGSWEEKMKRTEDAVKAVEKLNGGEQGVERVTGAVLDALTTVSPMSRYLVGLDANILGRVGPLIPDWIVDLLQTYVI